MRGADPSDWGPATRSRRCSPSTWVDLACRTGSSCPSFRGNRRQEGSRRHVADRGRRRIRSRKLRDSKVTRMGETLLCGLSGRPLLSHMPDMKHGLARHR